MFLVLFLSLFCYCSVRHLTKGKWSNYFENDGNSTYQDTFVATLSKGYSGLFEVEVDKRKSTSTISYISLFMYALKEKIPSRKEYDFRNYIRAKSFSMIIETKSSKKNNETWYVVVTGECKSTTCQNMDLVYRIKFSEKNSLLIDIITSVSIVIGVLFLICCCCCYIFCVVSTVLLFEILKYCKEKRTNYWELEEEERRKNEESEIIVLE